MNVPITTVRDPDVVVPISVPADDPLDVTVVGGTLVANVVMSSSPQPIKDGVGSTLSSVKVANGATAVSSNVLLVQHVDKAGAVLSESTQGNIDLNTANTALLLLDVDETGSRQLSAFQAVAADTANLAAIRMAGTRVEGVINQLRTESLSQSGTRVTLVDSHGRPFESYTDSEGEQHLGVSIRQSVYASTLNSSEVALPFGGEYFGSAESTLGVAAVQVLFKADQNARIDVEQSGDGVNWDLDDQYTYYSALGGDAWTTQAVGSYFRLHVTNTGSGNMSYMRLATAICPIVEALPRSLSGAGNLKTATNELLPTFGKSIMSTPHQQIQTATSTRLAGAAFSGTNPIDSVDTQYWTKTRVGADADATVFEGQGTLSTGVTANGSILLNSNRVGRFIGGSSLKYRGVIVIPPSVGANTKRWGAFDADNGHFFEWDGSNLYVVCRKSGIDSRIPSGYFNGDQGNVYVPTLDKAETWEIFWTNSSAWFAVGGLIIHKLSSDAYPLVATQNLKVGAQCVNTAGNTALNRLFVRSASVSRLGELLSQPTSAFQSGQIASRVLKYGAGNLHGVVLSALVNNSVLTFYDATSVVAANTIWSTGAHTTGNLNGYSAPLFGLPFSNGLTIAVTGANLNALIVFE